MTTVVQSGRRRFVRSARRLAVLGAAAAFTVLLAQHTTTAAFTAQTSDAGNTATTATTFCATPSSGFAVPGEDSSTNGTAGSTTQTNANGNLSVGTSAAGDGYGYIRFATLPTVPSGCTVTSATLTLYASTSQAATMHVYRANTTWTQATLSWFNQPAAAGTPVSVIVPGGAGPQVFPVTQHVRDLYGISNHGFLIRDAASLTSTRYQIYTSFENSPVGNRPKLEVTWG